MTKKKKIYFLLLAIIIFLTYNIITNYQEESYSKNNNQSIVSTNLNIYYFDVGQADSILISNNNHHMLIDAGNNDDGPKLVKYLKEELNIEEFDYVIGTHPHEDHIGGLDDIINNFKINNIYLPDAITTTRTFEDVIDAIANKDMDITIPEIGSTFELGEAIINVLYTGTDLSDLNNTSIVLKMNFGNTSYLFTGDATGKTEQQLLNKNIKVDVLKVGHHGSSYSTTNDFLEKVKPKYAIISVAKENSYNHPSATTINRLKKYTDNIYLTSELGTIKITSDGNNITINNFDTDING